MVSDIWRHQTSAGPGKLIKLLPRIRGINMASRLIVFLILTFLGLVLIQQHTGSAHTKLLQDRKDGESNRALIEAKIEANAQQKPSPSIKMPSHGRGLVRSSKSLPVYAGKQTIAATPTQDSRGQDRKNQSR
jgi:hypothetical protein